MPKIYSHPDPAQIHPDNQTPPPYELPGPVACEADWHLSGPGPAPAVCHRPAHSYIGGHAYCLAHGQDVIDRQDARLARRGY